MFALDSIATMKVAVAGATGKEGQRAVAYMKKMGMNVVAGVTPGKGGSVVEGTPIFNSLHDATQIFGVFDCVSMYIPPLATLDVVRQALDEGVKMLHILTEGVPYRDVAEIVALCENQRATVIGPGSLGIVVPEKGMIGMLGGDDARAIYRPGPISIISRSGGMANELARMVLSSPVGIRCAWHVGGETLASHAVHDALSVCEADYATSAILLFEELMYDTQPLISYLERTVRAKPLAIYFAGASYERIPAGAQFGHVDSLVKRPKQGEYASLLATLGVRVVESYNEFIDFIYEVENISLND